MIKKATILILLALLFLQCGKKSGTNPDDELTAAQLATKGWDKLSLLDLEDAITYFESALSRDVTLTSANVGRGWVLLLQNSTNYAAIENHFIKGKSDAVWAKDANCGLAVLRLLRNQYSESITACDLVLGENSKYAFSYLPSIDWHDLLVIKAEAQFQLKNYNGANTTINQIGNEFSLDPQDPQTWIIDGTQYFSFQSALSKAIEILADRYKF